MLSLNSTTELLNNQLTMRLDTLIDQIRAEVRKIADGKIITMIDVVTNRVLTNVERFAIIVAEHKKNSTGVFIPRAIE